MSSSEENIIRNNVVENTTRQGVPIQSANNLLQGNTIIEAGADAVYLVDQDRASPTPRLADGNRILANVIYDSRVREAGSFVGLRISTCNTIVKGNKVCMQHGRSFKAIKADAGNQDIDNVYSRKVERGDLDNSIRARKQIMETTPRQQ